MLDRVKDSISARTAGIKNGREEEGEEESLIAGRLASVQRAG